MPRSFVAEQAYQFRASPSKVFRALTDPKGLVSWFLSDAHVDPQSGGEFRFEWRGGYQMTGKVLRFTKGKSVSFLWVDRLPNGKVAETEATFRVAHQGRGSLLKLRHSGFTVPEHYAECSARWAYFLTNLKSVLDHGVDLRSRGDW